jgi:hypothetical protein
VVVKLAVVAIFAVVTAAAAVAIPAAAADGGNNQSPTVLCRDADYADLHPTLCAGPFSLGPGGGGAAVGGGGGGGLLDGIPIVGGLLHGIGL